MGLATWYIRHSIALATVLSDLGDRLESLLRPETRAVLKTVGPGGRDGGWLEHMRTLLGRRPGAQGSEGTSETSEEESA